MLRKLATIRRIKEITPIPNADAIETATVDGWQVVTRKGEFQPGDLVVYFEIDSLLPLRPEFEFLRKSSYRKTERQEGFRLRTVKLRGQISQGLLCSTDILPSGIHNVGDDLTETLGIEKFETPIPLDMSGSVIGPVPHPVPTTDQERIQNLWDDLSVRLRDTAFEETLKLDGTSVTIFLLNGVFGVCSRNWWLEESDANLYWQTARKFRIEERLRAYGDNLCIQAEIMGPGVQKNRERFNAHRLFVFDVIDLSSGHPTFLTPDRRVDITRTLDLFPEHHVPVLTESTQIFRECPTLGHLLSRATGPSITAPRREGLVFKPYTTKEASRSFKVINNEFLLKENK